ncbi:sigma-70 region 4 domain-containing protein [Streptomyces sp. DSM 44917]|uniref:Sigma-70 region 4 domain-containing protein n=1 Tax=Streptomyces boetiae TaxID=3075541 RepID=A0ABU2L8R5_9ACTN|nr:sigma-70 region 4 domain-containing protein [Streptomyces sp. DSM 44917]MDT0307970.1 sigma-70 region 4 domain-containing protein [Streptomyces sp. DSM 44917]
MANPQDAGEAGPPLPPDREAFRALHLAHYLGYARLHLPGAAAEEAVAAVFEHLFARWHSVLSTPNPAAHAWALLTARTRARPLPLPTLSPAQYDVFVLHHLLGCPVPEVATALGERPGTVRSLLSAAVARARERAHDPAHGTAPAPAGWADAGAVGERERKVSSSRTPPHPRSGR